MEASVEELGLSWGFITLLQTGEKQKLAASCKGCCIFSPAVCSHFRDKSFTEENEEEMESEKISS